MKIFKNQIALSFLLTFFALFSIAQTNNTCANATPFCTGNTMQFPAGVNAGSAQNGPNYGCLGSQPNPAWFYLQVANGGPIDLVISAPQDIDFICWGPFPNLTTSCGNLTAGNTQDCSFSGSATETVNIANAIPGQFYVLLITNFSNANQQITFNQTNSNAPGAGSTNCGVICNITATNSGAVCSGQSATLSLTSNTAITSYTWNGPGGFTSNSSNPVVNNITSASVFTLIGSTSTSTCQATTSVNVVTAPNYTVTPQTLTVCQGGIFTPSVTFGQSFTGNPCSNTGVGAACASPNITQIGTQTGQNGTTTWPAPYGNWYRNARHQMLFTAAELNAAGIGQGYLTSLAFNILTINGTTNYPGYTIRIKCTNVAALSGGFDNIGLFQVFSANHIAAVGWNTHNFATPYYWDGVSNLLVDICYTMTGSYTQNCISPFMNTGFNSCRVWYSDVTQACMTTNAPFMTNANRPLVRWGSCTSPNPNSFSYLWSPQPGISAPTASSTPITTQPITGTLSTAIYSVVVTPTNMNCPTMQTLTVTIVNPLTPTLTVPGPVCSTSGLFTLSAVPGGGTWTANTGVSGSGIFTPSLAPVGTSTVLYSTMVGSCVATNSANLNVSQFNTAALNASIAPMCVTSPVVNLNTIVQSTVNGIWSGANVTGSSFSPAGLATGIYTLNYNTTSSPDPTVCPDASSIEVSVLNPPTPTITAAGPFCNTSPTVQINVVPNTGTWTPVSYQNSSGVFDPSIASIGSNTVQYIIGTNTCNVQATSAISVEAFVPAVITGTVADQCNTNTMVNLLPLTAGNTGTWTGSGISGFIFDPATSGTGVITLTYNTQSSPSGLCPDQGTLAINVFSLATPALTQIGPYCSSHLPSQISVSPLGGMFAGVNNNAVTPTGIFNPANAHIGQNLVNYSVSAGPCVAFAQATVSVEAFVSADFSGYAGPYCRDNPPVNLNSIVQNQGGVWTGGAGLSGNMFNPGLANAGDNNVFIYTTHSVPTVSLCPDTSAIRIQVNDLPQIVIVSNQDRGCQPVEVIFNTPSVNNGSGTWNLGDGTVANGLTVTHLYNIPGSYTVTFNYEDEIGCAAQVTLPGPINVYEMPDANFSFSPDEITMIKPEAQFQNQSTILGNNTYQWQIGTMYQLNDVNPMVMFPGPGDYNVTLTATTIHGCKDVINRVVTVLNDYGVYVPSSFTPNFDGLNDVFIPVFSPYGLDLSIYELEIFDRWGHSHFRTKDFTQGWDGMAKGSNEPLKQDVYVYKIRFKDLDGKIHYKTGHVTLLK